MTVASSGVSMEVTKRRAPCFGDLLAGFMMKANVALTSAEVSARPSWKRTPRRSIGYFTEDHRATGAGCGRQIRGALMKCLVGQKGEGQGFLGTFGNAETRRG